MSGGEQIPLARPVVGDEEEQLVLEVMRSGRLSLGPMLARFEAGLAAFCGAADAVATSNGTTALHLAVRGLGWGAGDAVVTTPLSFVASSNCLLFEDVEPVFCDVDPLTLTLDPAAAAAAVGERTAGILPVHIFGAAAAMGELEGLAAEHGLGVIEDGCQAIGATDADGRRVGSRGNPCALAFYANKQLSTGEGGALLTDDPELAARLRSERNQGRAPDMSRLDFDRLGFNYRLTDIQAAIGVAQLARLESMLAERAEIARLYADHLGALGAAEPGEGDPGSLVLLPSQPGGGSRSWFAYLVQLPVGSDRRAVIDALAAAGVEAKDYLPCIHTFSFYRERFGYQPGQFPVAEAFSARSLSLPFWVGMGEAEVTRVVDALATALATAGSPTV